MFGWNYWNFPVIRGPLSHPGRRGYSLYSLPRPCFARYHSSRQCGPLRAPGWPDNAHAHQARRYTLPDTCRPKLRTGTEYCWTHPRHPKFSPPLRIFVFILPKLAQYSRMPRKISFLAPLDALAMCLHHLLLSTHEHVPVLETLCTSTSSLSSADVTSAEAWRHLPITT